MPGFPRFTDRHKRCAAFLGRGLLLTISGALMCACAPAAATPSAPTDPEAAAFMRILQALTAPAMEGRGVDTAGLERAHAYLVQQFERAGLEPAVKDNGEARFSQRFTLALKPRVASQALALQVDGEPARVRFEPGGDFNALGFSAERAFAGEPVVVGYGIIARRHDYNSYGDEPRRHVEGRVVIALRYEPMDAQGRSRWVDDASRGRWSESASLLKKAEWAAQHGAAALLVVNPHRKDDGGPLHSTQRTAFEGPADLPVMHIRNTTFRRMLEAAGRDALEAERIYQRRADEGRMQPDVLEGLTLRGEVDLVRPEARVANVVGMVPGRGALREEVVVLGAHYDHLGFGEAHSRARRSDEKTIHPGADDNASGVAGLLLAARRYQRLAATRDEGERRTVLLVAFTAEEIGLRGARHLVEHPEELRVSLEHTVAMVNLDMIGRLRRVLYVFGLDSGAQWEQLVPPTDDAALPATVDVDARGTVTGLGDHAVFYGELGVPVLHVFTGLHEEYHRPSDTAETINAVGGAAVARFTAELIEQLATRPEPIEHEQTRLRLTLPRDARGR